MLSCPSLHSLCELAPGTLRQIAWHGVIACLDGGVWPCKKFEQSVVHHHEGCGRCMVTLVVEVGCCFGKVSAAAKESSAQYTVFIKAATFLLCLGQDVVSKV